jgi:hypothetical protein
MQHDILSLAMSNANKYYITLEFMLTSASILLIYANDVGD